MAQLITTQVEEIPDYTRISDLKKQQNISPNRDIVEVSPQNMQRRADTDVTQPGGIYVDVPRYIRGVQNVARMMQEVALLRMALPNDVNIIYNHPNYDYILLENYPLGDGYEPFRSHIWINLPPEYPSVPPGLSTTYGIYLVGGLRKNGRALECSRDQYHWDCIHNPSDKYEKGWAWWCFARLQDWDPYKDNLFKLVVILTETLLHPDQQRFG